jgi:ubiquinone/menaquinone biosynthesis C-methylase UbiE
MKENTGLVNDWIVAKANPQPGQTWLDIAGGPGDLARALADRVGDDGHVVYTDFAPEMLEVARGYAEGRDNMEFRVLDAEQMDLDDDSFDGVGCRYGYMLMADPAAALRETRRVLRDGGPLCFAVWSTPDRNLWAAIPAMTLVQRGHVPPPDPSAPGIFAMGMPERIRELVTGAGFADPEIEEIKFEFRYASDDDLWDALVSLAGPLARVVNALPDDEREATRAAILENVATYRNDHGAYAVPASSWGVLTR